MFIFVKNPVRLPQDNKMLLVQIFMYNNVYHRVNYCDNQKLTSEMSHNR